MPELPDVTIYVEALRARILGHTFRRVTIRGPFLLRTVDPPLESTFDKAVTDVRRLGKRILVGVAGDFWLAIHLKISGRLHWRTTAAKTNAKNYLAAFEFDNGFLVLTEAGTQHRASLQVVQGDAGLRALDPGGIEVLDASLDQFRAVLQSENHTLKRALTDPRWFSGIGNAYSDEILHRASLSPVAMTTKLTTEQVERLFEATREVLLEWVALLRAETGSGFPEKVTAFRPAMAVHGKYGQPCPRCGAKVQRIRHASNETNYCTVCQTQGRLLADRALSRLLRADWPRTLEELEELKKR